MVVSLTFDTVCALILSGAVVGLAVGFYIAYKIFHKKNRKAVA